MQENLFNQWLQIFPVVYTTNSVNTMEKRNWFPGGSLIYERYRSLYRDMKKDHSVIDEKDLQYEMAALHRLLMKTGEITGIVICKPPKFIFDGPPLENRTHDIYDPISELFDAASKDPEVLSKIMRRMNQMLLENGELCTEDVEVLHGMASNS